MTNPQTQHDPGPLERLFGSTSATVRIIDFMSTFDCYDYNKKDIAENSNVSQKYVKPAIEKLEEQGIVKKTRKIGCSDMYQYNMQNQTAELLAKLGMSIAKHDIHKTIAEQEAQEQASQQQPEIQPEAELLTAT
ncbi:hypothetical protein [Candidatus Bathycorpusculum sp.]|uniref:hypothetical protein n=1 Tax=Candidatus Bathycorpusculum sp. TaxID=2994959 RepID=UPI002819148C|nr:hypothetical protein [Candidatus Termitimicrobium sp.]MCL2686898.1 hypothetical protein [Candidatus Termitimicrobium sp.]